MSHKHRTKVYYYFGIFVGISSTVIFNHFYPDIPAIALVVISLAFLIFNIVMGSEK